MRRHERLLQFLAVVFVALAVSYGAQQYLESSQHNQNVYICDKASQEHAYTNVRVRSEVRMRDALVSFERSAAAARLAAYHRQHAHADLIAARTYLADAKQLEHVPFPTSQPLKCPT
jgi:hypothetical protein